MKEAIVEALTDAHKRAIEKALSEGEHVPDGVLRGYPDLKPNFTPKDDWQHNLIKAREYAIELGIETRGKVLSISL